MNSLVSFFSSPAAEVIARTILHSFWQSAGILVLLLFILRITPERHSKARYIFAYASILLLLITSGVTFLNGWQHTKSVQGIHEIQMTVADTAIVAHDLDGASLSLLEQVNLLIPVLAPYIAMAWTLGVCLFLFRLSGSWWYLFSLRKNVTVLSDGLALRLKDLASTLKIQKTVQLAESASIHAPMVIGYLKPMLLIPVGFVSGLSTEQIEAIFIHELTHIQREDYLLNLIQAFAEALFFFNPFAWIISSVIRREREHCCDDAVIQSGGNALAYVHALALLEEHRTEQTTLALSAIGAKNQLLNRIKRIMEKSVSKYSLREKLVPAVLLVLGIFCASWVTITSKEREQSIDVKANVVAADTTIKKKNSRSATYSRKRVVNTDDDGKSHEEIVEDFSGDEELRPMIADFNGSYDFVIPAIPPMPNFDVVLPPHFDGFTFMSDSLPPRGMHNAEQWREFQEQFQTRFKEQFGDFYLKNQDQISQILNEMQPEFQARFNEGWAMDMEAMAKFSEDNMRLHAEQMKASAEMMEQQSEHLREVDAQMKIWERDNAQQLKKLEAEMKDMEKKMKDFEKELQENLRKDGYLKGDEKLHHMEWDDNGDIEINEMKIKPEHAEKYRKLHKKYFGSEPRGFRFED